MHFIQDQRKFNSNRVTEELVREKFVRPWESRKKIKEETQNKLKKECIEKSKELLKRLALTNHLTFEQTNDMKKEERVKNFDSFTSKAIKL